jgi:hypothetical protein
MIEGISAYPLCWPAGSRRAARREHAKFSTKTGAYSRRDKTVNEAVTELLGELRKMGVTDDRKVVVSTNLELRLDGYPRGNQADPHDCGVAVYWERKGKPYVMATDKYYRIADNIYAIAKTIEALRAIERWGSGGLLEQAFTGFQALPSPVGDRWWEVLGVKRDAPESFIHDAYVDKRKRAHPDHVEGSHNEFIRVQKAWDECCAERGFHD